MTRLGLSDHGARSGGLEIGADGSMSAGTGIGAALAVAVVAERATSGPDRSAPAELVGEAR